jgi:hypothetical protein
MSSRLVGFPTLQRCYAQRRRVPLVGELAHGFMRRSENFA